MTMNDIYRVMLDVSALVTRGSELASSEARRVAAERERRVDAMGRKPASPAT